MSGEGQNPGDKRKIDEIYGPETVDEIGWTEFDELESFTYLWKIKNFNSGAGAEEIRSPNFTGGSPSGNSWQLRAKTTTDFYGREHLGIFLSLQDFGSGNWFTRLFWDQTVKVGFRISLIDSAGHSFMTFGGPRQTYDFTEGRVWGRESLIATAQLTEKNRLPHDTLNVHCQIWYVTEPRYKIAQGGAPLKMASDAHRKKCRLEIGTDLLKFRQNDQFADITIGSLNKTYRAHKVILSARSEALRRIIQANPTGNTIQIVEYPEVVVEAMLDYIYGGDVKEVDLKAYPSGIIQIGQKFELIGLRELGELELAGHITIENAAEILNLAATNNCEQILKPKVKHFITKNLELVKQTPAFQTLVKDRPELVVEFTFP